MTSLCFRMAEQAKAQSRHFELDVTIGRAKHDWNGIPISEEDAAFISDRVKRVREWVIENDTSEFFSIGHVRLAAEERIAA